MLRNTLRLIVIPATLMLLLILAACGDDSATETAEPATAAPASGTPDATPATGASATAEPASAPTTGASGSSADPTASPPPQPAEPLQVVTTSNIVGDWVRNVGQERVDVFSLLPPDADPHTFQPGTRDIVRVADADVVMSVGLSLEAGWLEDLVESTARDHDSIVPLAEFVDAIGFTQGMMEEGEHADEHGDEHADEHDAELLGRLLIGDGETGAMSVIDLEHDEVEQDAFDLGSRAGRIYGTHDGRFAIAVSSDANEVHIFDGGIYMEEHGDHFDLVEDEVSKLDIDLSGDNPVHLYVGEEWATIFYDGSGEVVLLELHELEEEGSDYAPPTFNAGPHHGAAVPLEGDLFAVTPQHPDYDSSPDDYRLPIGADIRDVDGNILYSAEEGCEGLHGDASNGHVAVFGCVGGVLAVEAHDGEYSHAFISAPAGEPEDFRLTTVWGYHGLDHFFALGSAVGLYVVEPEEGEMSQLIASSEGSNPINASISHDGEALIVVMSDGELRMYDAHDLDLLASASGFLTTPVETGFWARPHLVTAPGAVFVTDSVGGKVLQLDTHDLEVVEHWDVDGTPTKIAFAGIMGEPGDHEEHGHEEEDEHGHEEEDEHGHEEEDTRKRRMGTDMKVTTTASLTLTSGLTQSRCRRLSCRLP